MRVGISEWSLHQHYGRMCKNPKPYTAYEFMDLAKEWGLDCIQVENLPSDAAELKKIRARAGELGVVLELEACGTDKGPLLHGLKVAAAIGSSVMRCFPGKNRYHTSISLKDQMDEAVDSLKMLAKAAEQAGIYVAIENHQDIILDRIVSQDINAEELLYIVEKVGSPFIGICLDTGNCLAYLDDPVETAELLAKKVFAVHVKDYRIKRTFEGAEEAGCALGDGVVVNREIIKVLKKKSPFGDGLNLFIEAPVERIAIPFLRPSWWDGYEKGYGAKLPKFLKFLKMRGVPPETDLSIGTERGESLEQILNTEKEQNKKSVEYLRRILK